MFDHFSVEPNFCVKLPLRQGNYNICCLVWSRNSIIQYVMYFRYGLEVSICCLKFQVLFCFRSVSRFSFGFGFLYSFPLTYLAFTCSEYMLKKGCVLLLFSYNPCNMRSRFTYCLFFEKFQKTVYCRHVSFCCYSTSINVFVCLFAK